MRIGVIRAAHILPLVSLIVLIACGSVATPTTTTVVTTASGTTTTITTTVPVTTGTMSTNTTTVGVPAPVSCTPLVTTRPAPPAATAARAASSPTLPPSVNVAEVNVSTCRASGSLWFIGELVNMGTADVDTLQVSVALLDGGGSTLTSGAADVIGV